MGTQVPGSKWVGVRTGRRVQDFQDWSLSTNPQKGRRLSDLELLREWRAEFPGAQGAVFVADEKTGVAIVRCVRRLFNAGRHCKAWPAPATPVPEFRDGKPVAVGASRTPAPAPTPAPKPRLRKKSAAPVAPAPEVPAETPATPEEVAS